MGNTANDLHIDAALSEVALGYRPEGFIADMVMPVVDVGKQSDLYTIWSRADRLRRHDTKRAPATEAKRIEESVSSETYFCNNYALKSSIPIEDFANADPIYLDNLNNGKTELVMDGLMMDWEVRLASKVTSGSNVGSYAAVSSAWNDGGAGSDPIGDVNLMLDNVQYSTGKRPNRLTFGLKAWQVFRRHVDVRNIIFGVNNGGGYASVQQVADLFEVEEILVGGTFQNTAGEGLTENLSAIWDDHILAHYTPMRPSKDRPSFAYSFRWNQPGLPNFQVERHPYDTKKKAQDLEVGYYQDEKIVGAEYAFLLTNVTSSS
jgi:hypothetical protein